MKYETQNFEHLLGLEGFSDTLLKTHFSLYEGYVKNVNAVAQSLQTLEAKDGPAYAELKRRFGWEFDGMRLHEYYFSGMKKGGSHLDPGSSLAKKLGQNFGSFEAWQKDFKAVGAMRGIGWAVLYYDAPADRLLNVWVNEHDNGHLTGCQPVLIMDVFEHAYMLDYGSKKAGYIEAFFKAVDWKECERRLREAESRSTMDYLGRKAS